MEMLVREFPDLLILFPFANKSYSLVCHQNPLKTIEIANGKLLVCARCSGIYIGALFSSIVFLFIEKISITNKLLIISSVPMFIDIILYNSGIYFYSKSIAFTTGIFLGSIGFFYISEALFDFYNKEKRENSE